MYIYIPPVKLVLVANVLFTQFDSSMANLHALIYGADLSL